MSFRATIQEKVPGKRTTSPLSPLRESARVRGQTENREVERPTLKNRENKAAGAQARRLALEVAQALDLKKGDDIDILDLRELSILADYFVLGAGFARIQIQALADAVLERVAGGVGRRPRSMEGYEDSGWILIDYGDVVVHLMTHECRDYYRLERLWGDAPRVAWNSESKEMERG